MTDLSDPKPTPLKMVVIQNFNRDLEWRCPACGQIRKMLIRDTTDEQLALMRMIKEHIQEGCAAYEKREDAPCASCGKPRSVLRKSLNDHLCNACRAQESE